MNKRVFLILLIVMISFVPVFADGFLDDAKSGLKKITGKVAEEVGVEVTVSTDDNATTAEEEKGWLGKAADKFMESTGTGKIIYLIIAIAVFFVLAKLVSAASDVFGKILFVVLIILLILALYKYLF